jgi:tRNA A37 threonylcarbamoyladenosine modification protein TsaB
MILEIDTTGPESRVTLRKGDETIAERKFSGDRQEAERLLPAILESLAAAGCTLADIDSVRAETLGGRFTSLRIGVTTANALGYAIAKLQGRVWSPRSIIRPRYSQEPNISVIKKKI